jgi:hypothetical protein
MSALDGTVVLGAAVVLDNKVEDDSGVALLHEERTITTKADPTKRLAFMPFIGLEPQPGRRYLARFSRYRRHSPP